MERDMDKPISRAKSDAGMTAEKLARPDRSKKYDPPITAADVREWFGSSEKLLDDAHYDEIAARLRKFRRPSDWLTDVPEQQEGPSYWDFQGATAAAKTLAHSTPAMLSFWDRVHDQARAGYEAIKPLNDTLSLPMP